MRMFRLTRWRAVQFVLPATFAALGFSGTVRAEESGQTDLRECRGHGEGHFLVGRSYGREVVGKVQRERAVGKGEFLMLFVFCVGKLGEGVLGQMLRWRAGGNIFLCGGTAGGERGLGEVLREKVEGGWIY